MAVENGIFYAKAAAFLGAAIAMGMGGIGPALGQGWIGTAACENMGKYPESAGKIRGLMFAAMAMVETGVVFSLLIAGALIYVGMTLTA